MFKCFTALMACIITMFSGLFTPVTLLTDYGIRDDAEFQDVKIMNFNVYVSGSGNKSPENRTDEVVSLIRKHMPDSFGVEEADEGWIERLQKELPEYHHQGLGRNNDYSGEASPVFYLADKYEAVSTETFWLSKTPEKPSRGWDAWINRVCTAVVLKNRETGFTYAHFNAHFDNSGAISRNEAVAVVSSKAKEYAMPVVFTGDLNSGEGTIMYNRILEAGFRDTKHLAERADSGATYHGYMALDKINSRPIDYIFVNSLCSRCYTYEIARDSINGIYPSDHYAVVSEMRLCSK